MRCRCFDRDILLFSIIPACLDQGELFAKKLQNQKMKVLHLESNEKKNSEKDLNKIEATFAKGEKKMNGSKNKLRK